MRLFLTIAAGLALALASANAQPPRHPPPTAAQVRACTAKGGTYRPVCMMQLPVCIITYKDAGKRCTDGGDCLSGRCEYTGPTPAPAHPVGSCAVNNDACGCHSWIEHGKASGGLCVD